MGTSGEKELSAWCSNDCCVKFWVFPPALNDKTLLKSGFYSKLHSEGTGTESTQELEQEGKEEGNPNLTEKYCFSEPDSTGNNYALRRPELTN